MCYTWSLEEGRGGGDLLAIDVCPRGTAEQILESCSSFPVHCGAFILLLFATPTGSPFSKLCILSAQNAFWTLDQQVKPESQMFVSIFNLFIFIGLFVEKCLNWQFILIYCFPIPLFFRSVQFSSVAQSCLTLCDPLNRSTPGLPVHHQLPETTQTHVHRVDDAIQPSHPLLSPFPPALDLSQHQGLFKGVSSSHQVAKVLEFQLQHQSFQ
ncbi:unnamed protein product [Rangifer tarandus platyrhynchus]|uniref:Uncharacterized protein n=2 Tax=Rangifer tarandus platyrhynchus TaxID=3082113 RepID=A0AC59Y6H6_RANTA|nr:unnamed protein product [Rangifer tarandus platyrhynchus]